MGSERYLGYIKTRRKGVQEVTRAWTIPWRQESLGVYSREQGTAGLSEVYQGQKRQEITLERRYKSRLCECSRLSLASLWYLVDTSCVKPKPRAEGIELRRIWDSCSTMTNGVWRQRGLGGQRPHFTSHVISRSFSFLIHKVRIVTLIPPRNAMRLQVLCEVVDACALMCDQRRSLGRVSQQQWRIWGEKE